MYLYSATIKWLGNTCADALADARQGSQQHLGLCLVRMDNAGHAPRSCALRVRFGTFP